MGCESEGKSSQEQKTTTLEDTSSTCIDYSERESSSSSDFDSDVCSSGAENVAIRPSTGLGITITWGFLSGSMARRFMNLRYCWFIVAATVGIVMVILGAKLASTDSSTSSMTGNGNPEVMAPPSSPTRPSIGPATDNHAPPPSDSLVATPNQPFLRFSETPTNAPAQSPAIEVPSEWPSVQESAHPTTTLATSLGPSRQSKPASIPTTAKLSTQPTTDSPTSFPTAKPTMTSTIPPSSTPSTSPTKEISFVPGNLTTLENGLLLSQGLTARVIAESGKLVNYDRGGTSTATFHYRPDAGATFEDIRPFNRGGWVYVSNSEMRPQDPPGGKYNGGVGALTMDKNGQIINYEMLLTGTTWNCGGGKTPWNTWVSCEEAPKGVIWQVSPFGYRTPEVLQMGNTGGRFESFAYDVRNQTSPKFFVTEDHRRGALQMWQPEVVDWTKPWEMLHGNGTTRYLHLTPNRQLTGGTFEWILKRDKARNNAKAYYPNCEGIDSNGEHLYFVSKAFRQLYDLNLDAMTYTNITTRHGLLDGSPDQLKRIMNPKRRSQEQTEKDEILYFTEEGGKDAGVHGRNEMGEFFTILESPEYFDETTGLAFSPDGKHLYIAYQENGILFDVTRKDGHPFHAKSLNLKYHPT